MDHNQHSGGGHGRRGGHFHRGRRGSDRRGTDRRQPPPREQQANDEPRRGGEHVDVDQIVREIRGRIAQRGIEVTPQQIQDLAGRRLDAILDIRTLDPALLEQLRKSAGAPAADGPAPPQPAPVLDESLLFQSDNGLMRFIRAILKPILKLFFNPSAVTDALNAQSRATAEAAVRDKGRDRTQAEWNALHYELLTRIVKETSRVSIEMENLALRVESLSGKVDFNERRVRGMEAAAPPASQHRHTPRVTESAQPVAATAIPENAAAPAEGSPATGDGQRRRRRRRRGRRGPGGGFDTSGPATAETDAPGENEAGGDLDDGPEGPDDDGAERDAAPAPAPAEPMIMREPSSQATVEAPAPDGNSHSDEPPKE